MAATGMSIKKQRKPEKQVCLPAAGRFWCVVNQEPRSAMAVAGFLLFVQKKLVN
jgi:hypothetical protein